MLQFVQTPESLLLHPRCGRCGECLVCADPHRCPALPEDADQRDHDAGELREQ